MKKARAMGFVCPDDVGIGVVGKFTGATVLNADRGAYFDIVAGLDFASLYPSIIRAWSLDYSTLVLDAKYDNLPGVEYYQVETDQGTFRFAQGFKGVLPALLEDLAAFRKAAKRKMADAKAAGDPFAAAIHNGSQNAFKVRLTLHIAILCSRFQLHLTTTLLFLLVLQVTMNRYVRVDCLDGWYRYG